MDQSRAFPFRLSPEQAESMTVGDFFSMLNQFTNKLLDEKIGGDETDEESGDPTFGGERIIIPDRTQMSFTATTQDRTSALTSPRIAGLLLCGLESALGRHLNDLAALLMAEPESPTRLLGMWFVQIWLEHLHAIGKTIDSAYTLAFQAWEHRQPSATPEMIEYAKAAKERLNLSNE